MKRMMIYIAAGYAALLGVIAGLSVALRRERARNCIPVPEVPEQVKRRAADVASMASDTASNIESVAAKGIKQARSAAEKAAHAIRR